MDRPARRRQVVARAAGRARRVVVPDGLRRLAWQAAAGAPGAGAAVLPAHVRAAEDPPDRQLRRRGPRAARAASQRDCAGTRGAGRAPADARRDLSRGRARREPPRSARAASILRPAAAPEHVAPRHIAHTAPRGDPDPPGVSRKRETRKQKPEAVGCTLVSALRFDLWGPGGASSPHGLISGFLFLKWAPFFSGFSILVSGFSVGSMKSAPNHATLLTNPKHAGP